MTKAERSAQIAQARVEVAKLDEAIAKETKAMRDSGSKVKRLQADANRMELKRRRAHFNRIIKDKTYGAREYR